MKKQFAFLLLIFFVHTICKGEDVMKTIDTQSILETLVGWMYDFQKDHARFPASLKDFMENKTAKRDYDPARTIRRNQELGYIITYSVTDKDSFILFVQRDAEKIEYRSDTDTFYRHQGNELINEFKLR
jgi:hypothetical protein